jgi:hypothetical protein
MRGRPPGTRHTSRHGPAKRAWAVIVPVTLLLAGLLAKADGRPQQISGANHTPMCSALLAIFYSWKAPLRAKLRAFLIVFALAYE